jgi:ribonuclease BN (tRNA processing enzyme)
MRRLLETGVAIHEITHLIYTHHHPDHTGELVPMLFASKYSGANQRDLPLTILSGKGFSAFFQKLEAAYGQWIQLAPGLMEIIELDIAAADKYESSDFRIDSLPVEHNPESLAFRISNTTGASVVISGDTDYTENLVTLSADADLLVCESALPDEQKVPGHLTPSLAGKIATRSRARKLVLTHFYPECDQVDIAKQCRSTYSGDLLLAEDLMRIVINNTG